VTLIGDSSLITYRLSTNHLELGEVRFCDWITKEFIIENTGKVTFEYRILHHQVKRKGYTECSPSIGRIAGGEK
jgi:hydrocephalus-inducing protein